LPRRPETSSTSPPSIAATKIPRASTLDERLRTPAIVCNTCARTVSIAT
jgi:hypothetical protein